MLNEKKSLPIFKTNPEYFNKRYRVWLTNKILPQMSIWYFLFDFIWFCFLKMPKILIGLYVFVSVIILQLLLDVFGVYIGILFFLLVRFLVALYGDHFYFFWVKKKFENGNNVFTTFKDDFCEAWSKLKNMYRG